MGSRKAVKRSAEQENEVDILFRENVDNIIPVDLEDEMRRAFIDYAMSVISDRALPDVRDGLKPVHRRILYSMYTQGFTPDKAYRKSVATVGDVLGRFHPHGDAAVYDTMVRLAQDFSMRHTLVDGHGNFGSRDGDAPAAYRYTEARLTKIAMEMLADINKDTVDFHPNFDEHEMEPDVLPSRFPNLLVNGSTGIAVGMATNIPTHNLAEVINACLLLLENPEATIDELLEVLPGPDFPTGGTIIGTAGIRSAYLTGRGRIVVRADAQIEEMGNNRRHIIISDLPYQVNKARLIEKIDEQVKSKRIQGVSFVRDESDRNDPVRIVIELKRDANPNVTLNQLYSSTQLQDAFNANMLALVPDANGVLTPQVVTLRDCLTLYINHQKDVILRRTRFDLDRAEARLHIIEGLRKAIDIINEVIRVIRAAENEPAAREALSENFGFSERQAQHIVDMRLGRLTGLERDKLEAEHAELVERITYLRRILVEESLLVDTVRTELIDIRDRYGDERRTSIDPFEDEEIMDEDLIPVEDVVVTLTHFGYVKRLPTDTYQMQHRGGRGVTAMQTREDDYAEVMLVTSTHSTLLFLTDKGRGYILRAWQIPSAGRQARGTAIVNLLQLEGDEKVETMLPIPDFDTECYLTFATRGGQVKKTHLSEFTNINRRGIIAINLREDDALLSAILTREDDDLFLVTHKGSAIRFSAADVRPTGRASQGVRGIRLVDDDYVAGFLRVDTSKKLLLVTENGFGKRTDLSEFRVQNRGGSGVLCYRLTSRTGNLAGIGLVKEDDDLILLNDNGVIIRMPVEEIPVLGRVTQGVTLMRTRDGLIVDGAVVPSEDNTDDVVGEAVCSAANRPAPMRAKDDAEDMEDDADDDTDDNIDYDVDDDADNDADYEGEDDSDL